MATSSPSPRDALVAVQFAQNGTIGVSYPSFSLGPTDRMALSGLDANRVSEIQLKWRERFSHTKIKFPNVTRMIIAFDADDYDDNEECVSAFLSNEWPKLECVSLIHVRREHLRGLVARLPELRQVFFLVDHHRSEPMHGFYLSEAMLMRKYANPDRGLRDAILVRGRGCKYAIMDIAYPLDMDVFGNHELRCCESVLLATHGITLVRGCYAHWFIDMEVKEWPQVKRMRLAWDQLVAFSGGAFARRDGDVSLRMRAARFLMSWN